MLDGVYESAWEHMAWRREMPDGSPSNDRLFTPPWEGDPLRGRTLLLQAEQGLGDTLQFARYLPAALQRAQGRVVLECPDALRSLLGNFPNVELHRRGSNPTPHHVHLPLMCLPRILRLPHPSQVPPVGYLGWPEAKPDTAHSPQARVGLVWAGNPRFANDRRRSLHLATLLPLLR